jgi:hypothetical protein
MARLRHAWTVAALLAVWGIALAEEGGEKQTEERRVTVGPTEVCEKAFAAAAAGDVDTFISHFDAPDDKKKEAIKQFAASLREGSLLNAAYSEKFKQQLPRDFALFFYNENPESFKNAKTLIDGKNVERDGRMVAIVTRVGDGSGIPLILSGTQWKIHSGWARAVDPDRVKARAARAALAKEITAAIKDGTYADENAAAEAMKMAIRKWEK